MPPFTIHHIKGHAVWIMLVEVAGELLLFWNQRFAPYPILHAFQTTTCISCSITHLSLLHTAGTHPHNRHFWSHMLLKQIGRRRSHDLDPPEQVCECAIQTFQIRQTAMMLRKDVSFRAAQRHILYLSHGVVADETPLLPAYDNSFPQKVNAQLSDAVRMALHRGLETTCRPRTRTRQQGHVRSQSFVHLVLGAPTGNCDCRNHRGGGSSLSAVPSLPRSPQPVFMTITGDHLGGSRGLSLCRLGGLLGGILFVGSGV